MRDAKKDAPAPARSTPPPAPTPSCPNGMQKIPGGSFWVGTEAEVYDQEENPKFKTQLPDFCAGTHEVSVQEYESCVAAGKCTAAHGNNQTCNTSAKGRANHPINCIDHSQAEAVCVFQDGRLPTEIEWEYLARGGTLMQKYPWGEESPDSRTCWKHAGTCERGLYPAFAFGLHDVGGNVWEWTSSWFGRYPWPALEGRNKVYRGGSWSRRFEKWMRPSLRNRLDPTKYGSHLGARCVSSLPGATCPYGRGEDGECRFGVDEVLCLGKEEWNGARCAPADSEARCGAHETEVPGRGCIRASTEADSATSAAGGDPQKSSSRSESLDTSSVVRARSPEFDADCRANQPSRPNAYKFTGGEHLGRNEVGKSLGCKNRDVGVGFNSSCCP